MTPSMFPAGHVSYSYICMEADSVYEYVFVNIILIAALNKKNLKTGIN